MTVPPTAPSPSDPPPTDPSATLAERARAGDTEAYERLFETAVERVHLFVRARLRRPDHAALRANLQSIDVLQEAYLAAHESFERFEWRGDRAFVAWLCGIADHKLQKLKAHHGAAKRNPRAAGSGPRHVAVTLSRVMASGLGVASMAARREASEHLLIAIETLEPRAREAILLRHFQDLTLEEIAQRLKCSEPTVRRLLATATLALGRGLRRPDSEREQ